MITSITILLLLSYLTNFLDNTLYIFIIPKTPQLARGKKSPTSGLPTSPATSLTSYSKDDNF